MISNAFRSAYQNEVTQRNQGINTITSGVKDLGTAVLGALGFSGALGSGAASDVFKHALANKIGGIGGNLMLASMDEKVSNAKQLDAMKQGSFTREEVGSTIKAQLGDNPINRAAIKQLNTVFDTLQMAKEQNIINKEGKIVTNFGEVDPNSELGKKLLGEVGNSEKKSKSKSIEERNPTLTITEEEIKKLENKGYFKEDKEKIEERVKARVGTTYNWKETGYITPDGSRIDLSGKNEGAPANQRSVDHRDIFELEDFYIFL